MTKFVYFLQINQIYSSALITVLVGMKIKCYLPVTYLRINFFGSLEITAFQRQRMYIITVQYIRTVHVKILMFRHKCTPCGSLCTADEKNNEFVVSNYLPIHIERISYRRFEHLPWKGFRPDYGEF
jgi:hypothetical protein